MPPMFSPMLLQVSALFENTIMVAILIGAVVILGFFALIATFYKKVPQGKALVVTGFRGVRATTRGTVVIPVLEQVEKMDISLQQMVIEREGKDGLICKDNMRADIKVAFLFASILKRRASSGSPRPLAVIELLTQSCYGPCLNRSSPKRSRR